MPKFPTFEADKRDSSAGDDFITLSSMFNEKGEFINSKANRKTLADLYGDELAEFGQAALDEKLAQLADKNSSVENLSVDDRKLLSGVLKTRLEDAGIKVNGHFLKRLNEGDADTFNKALGSLGSVKQTVLPENLSNEIAHLRDEIKTLSDKAIQTSDKAERADINKQIKSHDAKINSIQTLGKDIAKLEADLQKANDNFIKANATGNATSIAKASDKVTKLQTQLDAKQNELTKIISPQVRDATPQTEIQKQATGFATNLNADIQSLTAQITPDLTTEQALPLAQQIQDKTAQFNQVKKLNAQIDSLTTKAAEAIKQLNDAKKQLQAKEAKLDAQGLRENAGQITKLNQRRDKIQRGNNEIAKLNAQVAEAENQLAQTADPKVQETLKAQLAKLYSTIDSKTKALANYINPPQENQPETFEPSADVQAKVDEINARIRELRNSGEAKNSADISTLSRQANAIKSASKKVYHFTAQRDQAEVDGNAQEVQRLTGEIADWNKKIANATKRADEVLNPPQKPALKEKPQLPAKLTGKTARAISRLEADLANLDERLMSDLSEEQYAAAQAQYDAKRQQIAQIKALNEQVAAEQRRKDKLLADTKKARNEGDEATTTNLRLQFREAAARQSKLQADLDDLTAAPMDDEVAETVARLKAEIADLEKQLATAKSRADREAINTKLNAKKARLKNILDANERLAEAKAKLDRFDDEQSRINAPSEYSQAFDAHERAKDHLDKLIKSVAPKVQPSPKPEVQPTPQPTVQPTPQPEVQSTPKSEPQPAAQSQAKPELKQ